jgi:hypothetical protein
MGTVLAVSEAVASITPFERKFTRFVPISTGAPSFTTHAGLNT